MAVLDRQDSKYDVSSKIYTNTAGLINGDLLKNTLNNIIDSSLNKVSDKDVSGGYLSISSGGVIDVSFIKAQTPTGAFLRDDGTWATSATSIPSVTGQNNKFLTNDGSVPTWDFITSLGVLTVGTWHADVINVQYGGTGYGSYTKGDILVASGTSILTKLSVGTDGYVLTADSSQPTGTRWTANGNVSSVDVSGGTTGISFINGPVINSGTITMTGILVAVNGGTGISTYTTGDLIYGSATNNLSKLTGNITTTKQFLSQTGSGSISAAPVWGTITKSDIGLGNVENVALSTWPGTANITTLGTVSTGTWNGNTIAADYGGTGYASYTKGDLLVASGASVLIKLNVGTDGYILTADSTQTSGVRWVAVSGGVTSVGASGGSTGFSFSGGPVTGSGTLTMSGTLLPGYGGTGMTAYIVGDLIYGSSINVLSRLGGNITTVKQFLSQTGTGAGSAAPVWGSVSKTDVGLSNVENTALSTWAGTANITTLGTISTGTWGATAIAVNKGGTNITSYIKGDMLVASGTSTLVKLAVGTDGYVLIADSTQTSGIKWVSQTVMAGLAGTGTRMVVVDSTGLLSTSKSVINQWITDLVVIGQLENTANWSDTGVYIGSAIIGTLQSDNHHDGDYLFTCTSNNNWIRTWRL